MLFSWSHRKPYVGSVKTMCCAVETIGTICVWMNLYVWSWNRRTVWVRLKPYETICGFDWTLPKPCNPYSTMELTRLNLFTDRFCMTAHWREYWLTACTLVSMHTYALTRVHVRMHERTHNYRLCYIYIYIYIRYIWVGLGLNNLSSFTYSAFGVNCVITLGKGYGVQSALANQAIHPFGVGKLVPAISRE